MPGEFITNRDELLSDVFKKIIPTTESMYFLVGYFYFSGFNEVADQIADKKMRVLVGMEIESGLENKVSEVLINQKTSSSNASQRDSVYESIVNLMGKTDYYDAEDKQKGFKLFVKKILDGTLEIRKTKDVDHSKIYLFEKKKEYNEGGQYPGVMITGSSNLTYSGLRGQHETNTVYRDKTFFEGLKIFNDIWENHSIPVADLKHVEEFKEKVLKKIWIDQLPDPYLVYLRVLEEYFVKPSEEKVWLPSEITQNRKLNLKYQTDSIHQAISIINKHGGVIVGDVVGLGKSIISSAVARNLGVKTIIICPPHLVDQWNDYRYEFGFNAQVYSLGKIDDAVDRDKLDDAGLIIIDEAHKYRNEYNKDYLNLHKLCRNKKVMLLTATPYNNDPRDIFALIKLFQIPAKSTIQTVDNLSLQFKELSIRYKHLKKAHRASDGNLYGLKDEITEITSQIRDILSPLIIRRTRLDLMGIKEYREDLKSQNISFPKVKDPELLEYELGSISALYEETLTDIAPDGGEGGFIGARYKPIAYIKDEKAFKERIAEEFGEENLMTQSQTNIAIFMRRLLVRRFESSVKGFSETLDSMIGSSEAIIRWYEELGRVPIYKKGRLPDVDELAEDLGDTDDEVLKEEFFEEELKDLKEKGLQLVKSEELKPTFIKDVKSDVALLKDIRKKWQPFFKKWFETTDVDPKLASFELIIKKKLKEMPGRKIVVFTEFSDTADYVYEKMKNKLRCFKYTSADSNKTNKDIIRKNFDAGYTNQENEFDVLIATDAISEGFNLHRAGIIFNYDIPYNPTRVIQRVGRINRVNKKVFDELFIYNFFPTTTGERETRTKAISTLKISMIHALVGEDTKVLTSDEELGSYFAKTFRDAENENDAVSWDVEYRNFLGNIKVNEPQKIVEAMAIPKRVRIRRFQKSETKGVVVFAKKGGEYKFKISKDGITSETILPSHAIALFNAMQEEKAEPITDQFSKSYDAILKNLFERKTQVPHDKGKSKTIQKIQALVNERPQFKDYFEDLLYVIRELDSLPDGYAKQIRAVNEKFLDEDLEQMRKDISPDYLTGLIEKANHVGEGEELLILSEELV